MMRVSFSNFYESANQEFDSSGTSINQISGLHKQLLANNLIQSDSLVVDWGGGKFDKTKEYVESSVEEVEFLVYDLFNRSVEHNNNVIGRIKEAKGADIITCANVLNVIKEKEVRMELLKNIRKALKDKGTLYITTYNAIKSPSYVENDEYVGQFTGKGWQNAQPTEFYMSEVKEYFSNVKFGKRLIIATN